MRRYRVLPIFRGTISTRLLCSVNAGLSKQDFETPYMGKIASYLKVYKAARTESLFSLTFRPKVNTALWGLLFSPPFFEIMIWLAGPFLLWLPQKNPPSISSVLALQRGLLWGCIALVKALNQLWHAGLNKIPRKPSISPKYWRDIYFKMAVCSCLCGFTWMQVSLMLWPLLCLCH